MFLRRFAEFILQNRLQAMAIAFALSFLPLIGTVSILIAGLVTLRKGAFEGALVAIAATLPYLISFVFAPAGDQAIFAKLAIMVVVISNVLTWAFAILLSRYGNWSIILECAVLLGVLSIVIIHFLYPDMNKWWETQLSRYFSAAQAKLESLPKEGMPKETELRLVNVLKFYATGCLVASILLNGLLQLVVSRWWQAIVFNPGGLRLELYSVRFGMLTGALFVLFMLGSYSGNNTVLDTIPIFYLLFAAAGLSLVHCLIALRHTSWVWLFLVYLGIIWLFPLSIIILAILALFDVWIDFRKRLIKI